MAWTADSFRVAKPEFAEAADALVNGALADAAAYCNATVFADAYDQAIGLYAAHRLAISPFGQMARLESEKGESTYYVQWRRLARMYVPTAQTVGQSP